MNCLRQDLIEQLSHKLFEYDKSLSPIFETNSVIAYDDASIVVCGYLYIEDDEECYYSINLTNYYTDEFGCITEIEVIGDTGHLNYHYYFVHVTAKILTVDEYDEAVEYLNSNA